MARPADAPAEEQLFRYSAERIVLAAGQYREVSPTVAPIVSGRMSFRCEPSLPAGLQLDESTGVISGVPQSPSADADPAGPYLMVTVYMVSVQGTCATQLGIKVIDFHPSLFRISTVSKLDQNKYMVLVDSSQPQQKPRR
eukprot:CAMPEP_0206605522 /NCGR_PEP_ID=MMETSP0325_2-20121206/50492_1 /ASSEMBLY_ACC=CAM_ASM_000347 /TAXON_ID=2866 /ORGANISM="Crypthecodinium cohnii, Strain Seligo" /LENGTH=139 /DNA_ID=CAMNT_0054121135 /DNA_START=55 /DNA_END=474 /DNA_ORIENTATION=+